MLTETVSADKNLEQDWTEKATTNLLKWMLKDWNSNSSMIIEKFVLILNVLKKL